MFPAKGDSASLLAKPQEACGQFVGAAACWTVSDAYCGRCGHISTMPRFLCGATLRQGNPPATRYSTLAWFCRSI